MFTDVWQAAATTLYMSTGRRPNRHLYAEGQRKETTFRRVSYFIFKFKLTVF